MNEVELVECSEGITAVVTTPEGEMKTYEMTWEQFHRLQNAFESEDKQ